MDDGSVIQSLGDDWTFAGCKVMEWASGFVLALIVQETFFAKPTEGMPFFLSILIVVPQLLASLRRSYPDGETGIRNAFMVKCGLTPPGLPTPCDLQPEWSGAPIREMDEEKAFMTLGLDEVFRVEVDSDEQDDNKGFQF